MSHFWIILTGILCASSCSLLGSFLILRRMAMLGDAISHAVLPGLVIAFLISGTRSSLPMLLGATALGLLATLLIEFLNSRIKMQSDASIGITFTFLFAVGIIMVSSLAGQIDLDQDCVLYGEIAYTPLDRFIWNEIDLGPRSVWITGLNLLVVVAFILVGYKGLQITSFNLDFAKSIGLNVAIWQGTLMASVSMTTVLSFELVGAILVVAFLIVPAATAYLVTHELKKMLYLSVFFSILSVGLGFLLADFLNGSVAGGMATASGVIFAIVLVVTRFLQTARHKQKI